MLLWGIVILEDLHLFKFSREVWEYVSEWAQGHPIILLIAGFCWLGLLVVWPDLKPYLPSLPQTLHERVHAIHTEALPGLSSRCDSLKNDLDLERARIARLEEGAKEMVTTVGAFLDGHNKGMELIGEMRSIHDDSIRQLQEDRNKATTERSDLRTELAGLKRSLDVITQRQMTEVSRALNAIPRLDLMLFQYGTLLYEAMWSMEILNNIVSFYPQREVAKFPFASSWRLFGDAEPSSEAIRQGIHWAAFLETHYQRLAGFCLQSGIEPTELITGQLDTCISRWRGPGSNSSNHEAMGFLREHCQRLAKHRDGYAASFSATAAAIAATS